MTTRAKETIVTKIVEKSNDVKQKEIESLERYGSYGFDKTPTFIRANKKLSPNARSLYGALVGYDFGKSAKNGSRRKKHVSMTEAQCKRLCEESGVDAGRIVAWCYPSVYKLSRMLGYERNRNPVSKATRELKKAGLLLSKRRGNLTNLYVLLLPEILSAKQLKEEYWLTLRPLNVEDFWIPDDQVKHDVGQLLSCGKEAERIFVNDRRKQRRQNAQIRSQQRRQREAIEFHDTTFEVLDMVEQEAWKEFMRKLRERRAKSANK